MHATKIIFVLLYSRINLPDEDVRYCPGEDVTVPLVPRVDRIAHGLVRMDVIPSGLALGDPDYPVNWVIPPFIPFFRI